MVVSVFFFSRARCRVLVSLRVGLRCGGAPLYARAPLRPCTAPPAHHASCPLLFASSCKAAAPHSTARVQHAVISPTTTVALRTSHVPGVPNGPAANVRSRAFARKPILQQALRVALGKTLREDGRRRFAAEATGRVERVDAEKLVDEAAGDAEHCRTAVVALSVELEGFHLREGACEKTEVGREWRIWRRWSRRHAPPGQSSGSSPHLVHAHTILSAWQRPQILATRHAPAMSPGALLTVWGVPQYTPPRIGNSTLGAIATAERMGERACESLCGKACAALALHARAAHGAVLCVCVACGRRTRARLRHAGGEHDREPASSRDCLK